MKPIDVIKKFYCSIILISSSDPAITVVDKIEYWFKAIATTGLIAVLLTKIGLWYTSNSEFVEWVFACIVLNATVGGILHKKQGTFSWKLLIKSTIVMLAYLLAVYMLLDALRSPLKDQSAGVYFKMIIEIATLLWPVSKALKNIHFLTDKKHPPSFIMNRLYNFEKNGDEKALFGKGKDEEEENNNLDNVG